MDTMEAIMIPSLPLGVSEKSTVHRALEIAQVASWGGVSVD